MAVVQKFSAVNLLFFFGFIGLFKLILCPSDVGSIRVSAVNNVSSTYTDLNGFTSSNFVSVGLPASLPVVSCAPCAGVYNVSPTVLWARLPGCVPYRPRPSRSLLSCFVAFLLITVESNPGPPTVRFGVLNARSAVRKGALINDVISDNRLDVLAVCESWMRDDMPAAVTSDIAPSNYSVLHVHRPRDGTTRRSKKSTHTGGGGLAFVYSNDLAARPLKTRFSSVSFELQLVGLQVGKALVKVANIYRAPDKSKVAFLDEFADLLTVLGAGIGERLLICGDFNMPGDDPGTIDGRLSTLLDTHGYQQHVSEATRRASNNLLDLVITPVTMSPSWPLVSGVAVHSSHELSDHDLVVGNLSVWRHKPAPINYSYRNIRSLDKVEFEKRLSSSRLFTNPADTPDEYLQQLESTVTEILDDLAPMRHGTRPGGRKGARWLEPEAIVAKKHRRRLERRWKKYGNECDRIAYRAACRRANKLIDGSRNRHRYQRIVAAGNDSRRAWSAVKDLLYTSNHDSNSPPSDEDATFCSALAVFFVNKVRNIKSSISSALAGRQFDPLSADIPSTEFLSEFYPVTEIEVVRLLKSMPSKSSPLDFAPTSLIKSCSSTFAIIIARLANLSFGHSTFPQKFKTAQVTPQLKKRGLDACDPASYRPISNLNTVSKILERLVLARIISHVYASPSIDAVQSAYRKCHSTETALLKITDDIFAGFDVHQSTILVALDQSAAFDCIDHDTLFRRLNHTFGVTGNALGWLRSYLDSRSTFVRWKQISSDCFPLDSGVPQGSALGPLLFSLYIAPLSCVIRSSGVNHHQYADDAQIYIAASKSDLVNKVDQLQNCIANVHSWLQQNGLQLNPSKSEVIQFTACRGRDRPDDVASLRVSEAAIQPSEAVRSLGVTLDRKLTFDQHVTAVCKACYCHIRALRHVRESLPDDVAQTVACSIVGSRLDYCNSLFAGMAKSNFTKLQRVQNTLARAVLRRRKSQHITPALAELHWLPIEHRVTYKLASLAYRIKTSNQPTYLRDLLVDYEPTRILRSSYKHFLVETKTNLVLGSSGFRHSAAATWNSLPDDVRDPYLSLDNFKRKLKTYLFKLALPT